MISHQQLITWQREQADLVNDEIEALLDSLPSVAGFSDIIREPLAGFGQKMVSEAAGHKPWHLLPLIVCEAISGYYEHAIPASVAMQLFMAAGEVFDDIEDADAVGSLLDKYGSAIATNAATVLLILAEKAISQLKVREVTDFVIVRVMEAVNSFYSTACAGQHLDLTLISDTSISEDMYLLITSMKSASTIECACHIGALLGTASQELIESFTLFGHNLGMASQIANDIHGITFGNDIVKQRVTLSVIYAIAHTNGEAYDQLELAFSKSCESLSSTTQIRDLLFRSGAIYYTAIKMEFYKQRALDILMNLGKAGANVERLKSFLD